MKDPREDTINAVARKVMMRDNYDPHYATLENRLLMETRLFLARFDALQSIEIIAVPISMILFCPSCGFQHIDKSDPEGGWNNPTHRTHLCSTCGHNWRPADVPTTGVAEITTTGKTDHPAIRRQAHRV